MSSSARTHVGLQFDIERVYARRFVLIFVCSRGPRLSSACRLSSMTDSTLCTRTRFATTPRSPDTRATTSARRRREGVFLRPVDVYFLLAPRSASLGRVAMSRSRVRSRASFPFARRRAALRRRLGARARDVRGGLVVRGGSYSNRPRDTKIYQNAWHRVCWCRVFTFRRDDARVGGARARARTRVRVTVRGDGARAPGRAGGGGGVSCACDWLRARRRGAAVA